LVLLWVKSEVLKRNHATFHPFQIGRPEEYVDRDRIIAVNLGPMYIRSSMLKQRMFLNKTYVFMQEEQQGYKILMEQAAHETHKGAFDRALSYLNDAIRVILL
jgi:hypothetical protein